MTDDVARLRCDLQATEQSLSDERARTARMEPMHGPAHEVARTWNAAYLFGDAAAEIDLRWSGLGAALDALLVAHRATTPSPTPPTHVVIAVDELRILKAQADGQPEGEYACTVCGGRGEVQHGGYYVPGEQFCEPPGEERCEACVGSGQREVQSTVDELAALREELEDLRMQCAKDTDELARLKKVERAAEDWATSAAREQEFLKPTGKALFTAVRGTS